MYEPMHELVTVSSTQNLENPSTNISYRKKSSISYEDKRRQLRQSNFTTMALVFKSTVGICYFNYHFAIYKVGIALALIYNIFIGYLTTYGIYRVTELANNIDCIKKDENSTKEEIEAQNEKNLLRVFHELPIKLKIQYSHIYQNIILICVISLTASSCIANMALMSTVISVNLGINLYISKLIMVIVFSQQMIWILEPEKIKCLLYSITCLLLVMVISVCIDSFGIYLTDPNTKEYNYAIFANSGVFLGVSGYAFESVAHIFNVRRTMQDRSQMPKLQSYTFVIIAASYYITGLQVYQAYGNGNIKQMVFEYYDLERPFMYSLQFFYIVTGMFNIPFNTISLCENLEPIAFTRKFITDENGKLHRMKLLVVRILSLVVFTLITLLSDNVTRIVDFAGSTCSPVISYIIPVLLCWKYDEVMKLKPSQFMKYHDVFVIFSGVFVSICGIYSTIYSYGE